MRNPIYKPLSQAVKIVILVILTQILSNQREHCIKVMLSDCGDFKELYILALVSIFGRLFERYLPLIERDCLWELLHSDDIIKVS